MGDWEPSTVDVYMRVRPLRESERRPMWDCSETALVDTKTGKTYDFGNGHVFCPSVETVDVYETAAKPVLERTLSGYHGYIFAYGQTSSGKTYTMLGTPDCPGVIPLTMADIFRPDRPQDFTVSISYLEIYQESVRDLLNPKMGDLSVFVDEKKVPMVYVGIFKQKAGGARGKIPATERTVTSLTDAMDCVYSGEANRHYGKTRMNAHSSRSHTILRVQIRRNIPDSNVVHHSELYLIDLAGSESVKRSQAVGKQVKEAGRINRSLLALERVVAGIEMAQKGLLSGSSLPSTRDSKLTRFLKPAIGGNAFTAIICTVTPAEAQLFETLNTISFGLRAKNIKNIAKLNESRMGGVDPAVLAQLRQEMAELARKLLQSETSVEELRLLNDALRTENLDLVGALKSSREEIEVLNNQIQLLCQDSLLSVARDAATDPELEERLSKKLQLLASIVLPNWLERQQLQSASDALFGRMEEQSVAHSEALSKLQTIITQLEQALREKDLSCTRQDDRVRTLEISLDQATEMIAQHMLNLDELQHSISEQDQQTKALSDQLLVAKSVMSTQQLAEFHRQCDSIASLSPSSDDRRRLALNDRVRALESEISHLGELVGPEKPEEAFADKQIETLVHCINTFRTWSEVWGGWHSKQDEQLTGVRKAAALLQEQIGQVLTKSLESAPHAGQPIFSSSGLFPAVSGG